MDRIEAVDKKDWFGKWFDSPYYHILYKNRDFAEARRFIDNVDGYFKFDSSAHVMDLACGKGRHSIYLNQKGHRVTGLDLSPQNIAYAKSFENELLDFDVHDMREVYAKSRFSHVVNLFTSFGYFSEEEDNLRVFQSVCEALKPGGYFLLDYLNPDKVIDSMKAYEVKNVDGVKFEIRKAVENGFIVKDISFEDGSEYHFQERVQVLREEQFEHFFEKVGLDLKVVYGDYDLNPFSFHESDRMIFIAQKPTHAH
ncbi:class I SAM-dependent methyltransferase [Litoribacter alkaliphilus]|uniref:Class I SAM-dependent methyltransferase n=1 Tax=Litoribacter ruber TaxID=702568 RepID=A0AAP2CHG4_9BACT|nr:class I SAM-dependent methyltransferase [Litoribacter alkaliphilus]MBS9523679.1 class I SAM-dependent methyltransferase [Litoribacter alkaliphilus]